MSSLTEQLKEIKELHEQGILTDEEFAAQKESILKQFTELRTTQGGAGGAGLGGETIVGSVGDETTRTGPPASMTPVDSGLSGATTVGAPGASSLAPSQPSLSGQTEMGGVATPPSDGTHTDFGNYKGLLVGDYKIVDVLGQGGMGSVFRGRHKLEAFANQVGDVAIKMMHPQYASNEQFSTRFIQEASLGTRLSHPNIARVRHVNTEPLALVMEYVEGEELRDLIPERGMILTFAVAYLKPIAEALDYLHENGVVHRDVKPENIKIRTSDARPMLLDFGIAKDISNASSMTKTNMAMGTELYMAPEQLNAKSVGPASDQYAFAIMTFQLLTGSLPWDQEETSAQVIMRKMMTDFKTLQEFNTGLPLQTEVVLKKAMDMEMNKRHESCSAFVEALASSGDLQANEERLKKSAVAVETETKQPVDSTPAPEQNTNQESKSDLAQDNSGFVEPDTSSLDHQPSEVAPIDNKPVPHTSPIPYLNLALHFGALCAPCMDSEELFAASLIPIFFIQLVTAWKVFKKMDIEGILLFVPILNVIMVLKRLKMSPLLVFLYFIPYVNYFAWMFINNKIGESFGAKKSTCWGLALVPTISFTTIAFNNYQFRDRTQVA